MTDALIPATGPTWNIERDNCQVGNIVINRIVDLENIPCAAEHIYPDATPEIMEKIAGRLDKIHFGDTSSDLYLSFHSLKVGRVLCRWRLRRVKASVSQVAVTPWQRSISLELLIKLAISQLAGVPFSSLLKGGSCRQFKC